MQKVNSEKLSGSIEILSSLMLICIVGLMLMFSIRGKEIKLYQQKVQDSLDLACLSAAIVDDDVYEETGQVRITDIDTALYQFFESFETNMDLDLSLTPKHENYVSGKIKLENLYIFNVINGRVLEIYSVNGNNMSVTRFTDAYDDYSLTPNGKKIVTATVYARVGSTVRTLFGKEQYVRTVSCIDVVKREGDGG